MVLKSGTPAGPYATVAAATEAGAVTWNVGLFVNAIIKFAIVAFALFMVVRGINRLRQEKEAAPATPPAPSKEEVLLTEIRDLLKDRPAA